MADLPNLDNVVLGDLGEQLALLTLRDLESLFEEMGRRFPLIGRRSILDVASVQTAIGRRQGSLPPSAIAIGGQLGTPPTAVLAIPTVEIFGTQMLLDVTDLGGVSPAAIYDVTSGVNAPLDTGILDVSSWRELLFLWSCSAGTSAIVAKVVDDAGLDFPGATLASPAAALAGSQTVGPGGVIANALPRRAHFTASAAGPGNTVRLRIEGRR